MCIRDRRGTTTKERMRRNFGMAHPEGYRKARRLMRQAEKFGRPVLCLVDTSGAFCGIEMCIRDSFEVSGKSASSPVVCPFAGTTPKQ